MSLIRSSFMEPLFPMSFANRELRNLRQLADQMENSFRSADGTQHHVPNYEYQRDENNIYLQVELPGVRMEHIEMELRAGNLHITGRRFKKSALTVEEQQPNTKQNGEGNVNVSEAANASMVYQLAVKVGENVDEGAIKADHRDGMLNVMIPIKKKPVGRKIAITQGQSPCSAIKVVVE
eukprot:TRINITY_DN96_c1_g1_i3.p1 TRINITY_DN96_c1_g1~~TRINITY_DN96_c1_g1_i3.p1  ORF type:complete len:179 (-),score=41.47 TRINITY_DN96_c1_g1_i3:115-651(-)